MRKIGSRYRTGLTLTKLDSRDEGDAHTSYTVRHLKAYAEIGQDNSQVELVAYVELETVVIENGMDHGHSTPSVEAYRVPFPKDLWLRKRLLRLMRTQPKFFVL